MVERDLLLLCHRIPFPPNKGDKIRAHALLAHLARNNRVHLGCFVDDPADMAWCSHVEAIAGGQCLFLPLTKGMALARAAAGAAAGRSLTEGYFHHPRMDGWISQTTREYRIGRAVVFGSAMAPYILGGQEPGPANSVFDMVDVDSDKWAQYARNCPPSKRWIYALEARRLLKLETRCADAFAHTVLVSPHEAATFADLAPSVAPKLRSIGNGVDLSYFDPRGDHPSPYPDGEMAIVMTGLMDYWPNSEGARWFAESVLPQIRARWDRARFYAVGANPAKDLQRRLGRHTVVTGRVDDIRPYLAHAAAVVAPLRIARGVQNKVLEALAMARPVVATGAAVRGLTAIAGKDLLVADDPHAFAQAVLDVFEGACSFLGPRGRIYVETYHRWERLMTELERLLWEPGKATKPSASFQAGSQLVPI